MSYKAGITKAIEELKDRTGSSSTATKKHMQQEVAEAGQGFLQAQPRCQEGCTQEKDCSQEEACERSCCV